MPTVPSTANTNSDGQKEEKRQKTGKKRKKACGENDEEFVGQANNRKRAKMIEHNGSRMANGINNPGTSSPEGLHS
jgi:hypothetical protein